MRFEISSVQTTQRPRDWRGKDALNDSLVETRYRRLVSDHDAIANSDEKRRAQAAKYAELAEQFDSHLLPVRREWMAVNDQIPKNLYHYTTLSGLKGILSEGNFWASDVRFMNDSSELTYAIELIDAEVKQVTSNSDMPESIRNFFYNGGVAHILNRWKPFVACFCEAEDLLSQWRGYGNSDAPVALGLNLVHYCSFYLPSRTIFRKVIYEEEKQRQLVRDVMTTWRTTLVELLKAGTNIADLWPHLPEYQRNPALDPLREQLIEFSLCFKHPTFAEESEWRLIKLVAPEAELSLMANKRRDQQRAAEIEELKILVTRAGIDVPLPEYSTSPSPAGAEGLDIKFRTSPYGFIPYLEIPVRDQTGVFNGLVPLSSVTQGPRAHPEIALESLALYLGTVGYAPVFTELKMSGVPLRC